MPSLLSKIAIFLSFCLSAGLVSGQVLTTAETLGKGKQAAFVSENRLYVDDVLLNIAYAQYIRGLTPNFDLYISAGDTRISQRDQPFVGLGGNLHLFKVKEFNVSSFNMFFTGLSERKESASVLLNSGVIVSRNITKKLCLYSGTNSLWPIGANDRGLFTPPTKKINFPIGGTITMGSWALFLEADVGHLKALGLGISKSF